MKQDIWSIINQDLVLLLDKSDQPDTSFQTTVPLQDGIAKYSMCHVRRFKQDSTPPSYCSRLHFHTYTYLWHKLVANGGDPDLANLESLGR